MCFNDNRVVFKKYLTSLVAFDSFSLQTLSRAGGGTGPTKPGNLALNAKVPNPSGEILGDKGKQTTLFPPPVFQVGDFLFLRGWSHVMYNATSGANVRPPGLLLIS
jgi:hypothetical protein